MERRLAVCPRLYPRTRTAGPRGRADPRARPAHGQAPALQLLQRERLPAAFRLPERVFRAQGVGGPHGPAHVRGSGPRRHRFLQRAADVPPRLRLHCFYGRSDRRSPAGPEKRGGRPVRQPRGSEHPALWRPAGRPDLRRHLPRRLAGHQGARLPAGYLHRGKGRGRFPHLFLHRGRDGGLHVTGRDPQSLGQPGPLPGGTLPPHRGHLERRPPLEPRTPLPLHPYRPAHPSGHQRPAGPCPG